MKLIERRFKKAEEENPRWSSYTCFAEAIKVQRFSKSIIDRWFQKLVENKDYSRRDKGGILLHLNKLSKRK